ncbi:hypothetical protein KCU73_g80, partial [Aureobasidium melanogenum]
LSCFTTSFFACNIGDQSLESKYVPFLPATQMLCLVSRTLIMENSKTWIGIETLNTKPLHSLLQLSGTQLFDWSWRSLRRTVFENSTFAQNCSGQVEKHKRACCTARQPRIHSFGGMFYCQVVTLALNSSYWY